MKLILIIIGVLISIASVLGVAYFGFVFMFVGGIVQVVEAFKATPVVSTDVAWGIAKVFFTGFFTGILAWGAFFLNALMWATILDSGSSRRRW